MPVYYTKTIQWASPQKNYFSLDRFYGARSGASPSAVVLLLCMWYDYLGQVIRGKDVRGSSLN